MGVGLLTAAVLLTAPPHQPLDTLPTYSSEATRALVARAQLRHAADDTTVTDYTARLRYRVSFALGRRKWARVPTYAVEEQEGTVHWQAPNDIRLDILGRRNASRSKDITLSSDFSRPWFVPRGLGDSVRIFGNDFPTRAALHPLAADGPEWYRYELTDSIALTTAKGTIVRLFSVEVVPARPGPSLVAGTLWLDAATAQVARFTFRYVGNELWVDRDDDDPDLKKMGGAKGANSFINRILTVDSDLEYGLQDEQYWMPSRQVLSGTVQIPIISDVVIPFEAITTFWDYDINAGTPVVFDTPPPDSGAKTTMDHESDSLAPVVRSGTWAGGRYEIHRPPVDTLKSYAAWGDSLQLDLNPQEDQQVRDVQAELATLTESLPSDVTGIKPGGVNYEAFADIFRYNRVQGPSLGYGYAVKVPGWSFTRAQATLRFGFSDARFTGQLGLVREAPSGRWKLEGYRSIAEVEPFFRVNTFGNTLNGVFAAHDDADYYLAQGGRIAYETSVGRGLELGLQARFEDQQSVSTDAHSAINDFLGGSGDFPANPGITEGFFVGVTATLDGVVGTGTWRLGAEGLGGADVVTGRFMAELRQRAFGMRGVTLTGRAGVGTSDTLPQSLFRLGGLKTVRGFNYGTDKGQAFWSLQGDWTPLKGHVRPVLFLDIGQAGELGSVLSERPLIGAGAGVSFFNGIVRFDLSVPLAGPAQGLRFDIQFGAPR
ncbi:MAG TPA: hypothetical protein PK948_06740 [Gemmatimonadales bacterium]|nr:hypothetical protein [Gemmatimonadales bacterium]